mmetsp:Transcript_86928/g.246464  ORF Transcript_86928/g.246464 Transcript_86928/m.246464 type:complete len:826 (+) Transcript_86928:58-2535(+)|eukprot:CAMPEP_0168477344 /NCGR_PEP_ID=MMETSP0228-20121227/62364_1 /TAXON_ID=133427 /ORGANISM="Protoceratium reticulatum, Strain CCCM 535 (=CCMP 1889)" /LENGTH=825 /DNA_ID=CAMNT_0008493511 /DNA_START=1 /DNA_END=2478 /DNA_ORIENTATION=+
MLILVALLTAVVALAGEPSLEIDFEDDASFAVKVSGRAWMLSAPLRLFADGSWHSTHAESPSLIRTGARRYQGTDDLGAFTCTNVSWSSAGLPQLLLHTSLKQYLDGGLAVFVQELPHGAARTNASNPVLPAGAGLDGGAYPPIVAFPAFHASGGDSGLLSELGYVTWQGCMAPVQHGTNAPAALGGLSSNGPVALFDQNYSTLVVSPMDNFKSAVHTRSHGAAGDAWETGVSSEVESLPPGFVHRTLLVAGRGITATLHAWGRLLRRAHGTRRTSGKDVVSSHLSYFTDNGAYYYGDAWGDSGGGGGTCNETSMLEVAEGLRKQDLLRAVRTWQLDDWWYPGHRAVYVHCVRNWTLTGPAFRRDLASLSTALETPWLLYVPFFCAENAYSGQFRFVTGSSGATEFAEPHPDDALKFYRMLFDYGVRNGMRAFEHDFLNYNFLATPLFRKQLGAADRWLQAIDAAALERGLSVQACMALPSDLMASVRLNSVTNYRASGDYVSEDNYDVGGSALLAFALGLRPSKDNFWTHRPLSAIETGKPWGPRTNPGTNCELNAIIATLSTGPVGIADKAGDTNTTLVLRCVRPDGLIMQPDRPATYVDAMFMPGRLGNPRPSPTGMVWATHASVPAAAGGAPSTWHYVLSIDVRRPWQLSQVDPYPPMAIASGWVARRWHRGHAPNTCVHGQGAVASGCLIGRAIRSELDMPQLLNNRSIAVRNDTHVFDLLQLSPIGPNGWVLIGETERYVSVSSKRFESVTFTPSGVSVLVHGAAGEELSITALRPYRDAGSTGSVEEWSVIKQQASFTSPRPMRLDFGNSDTASATWV